MTGEKIRCEICRRSENLGRHVVQSLVRGERSCNAVALSLPAGWIDLCGLCHGSVHRVIETAPDSPNIQVTAVEQVIARVERAFLGQPRGKRRAQQPTDRQEKR